MEIEPNLRVSTMTLISGIDSNINLKSLYESLEIDNVFRYIEYGDNPKKGIKHNKIKNPRSNKTIKYFYNQITLHVFINKIINVKIFNNGKFQMTGVKTIEQGKNVVDILFNYIKSLPLDIKENVLDNTDIRVKDLEIGMINSDFNCGFKINREKLHRIVISMGYYSSFEPSIYPGVNIKYYYNPNNFNGICNCECICDGKGKNGNCKKITVAVFNSGSTIITGAKSCDHLSKAYKFINKIINDKKEEIMQKE
tara:strand:- start:1568 stop:2326 length:759 start_codon:yes stop_codon:yes gene_type:complete